MNNNYKALSQNLLIPQYQKPLGEILIESGLVTAYQIELALKEQIESNVRIGEILANNGFIKQKTADFFVEKWYKRIASPNRKPLVVYFLESGLLDKKQVKRLLRKQEKYRKKIRFHNLVVEEGYLKQITVDYFIANLFNIYSSKIFSFSKPYEILKEYNKGKTDFQRSQLIKAPLRNVTLKGIQLDDSDLRDADLQSCNLSFSSLINANLTRVNLNKAVLTEVNFKQACLRQTYLKESYLEKANFQGANLQKADLRDAYLLKASFIDANLRGAKLPTEYPYDVYYNSQTSFDDDFNPVVEGWIKVS